MNLNYIHEVGDIVRLLTSSGYWIIRDIIKITEKYEIDTKTGGIQKYNIPANPLFVCEKIMTSHYTIPKKKEIKNTSFVIKVNGDKIKTIKNNLENIIKLIDKN